jgi:hypothetical protein
MSSPENSGRFTRVPTQRGAAPHPPRRKIRWREPGVTCDMLPFPVPTTIVTIRSTEDPGHTKEQPWNLT